MLLLGDNYLTLYNNFFNWKARQTIDGQNRLVNPPLVKYANISV